MKKIKGHRSEVKGEPRKPKMTAEQKACLAACKSFDADVERAKYIISIAGPVRREMCKECTHVDECAKDGGYGMSVICRVTALLSVAVGIIQEGGAK